jgi:hypothetical protein
MEIWFNITVTIAIFYAGYILGKRVANKSFLKMIAKELKDLGLDLNEIIKEKK